MPFFLVIVIVIVNYPTLVRTMSEVEEHATVTDSENATSEPPAKKR